MKLEGKKVGFCLTGSFCTFKNTILQMKEIVKQGGDILPIMSYNSYNLDTKFGNAKDFINEIEEITGKKIIHTIQEAEPIGPKKLTDIMIIAPCSRKYHCKTCKWYNRYPCTYGCKCPLTLMAEDSLQSNQSLINEEVELDCVQVSKIFKKIKSKGILQHAIHYCNNNYVLPSKNLLSSKSFIDNIKYYRLLKRKSKNEIARKVGIDDESYREYEIKKNEIQDWRIAEKLINVLEIEKEVELPIYFRIMKKYPINKIKDMIINQYSKKELSEITGISRQTINSWYQKESPKSLSTYTYKKLVKFFIEKKIEY